MRISDWSSDVCSSDLGAGSDLASLRTSARAESGHYVVNGQKIWSSAAMHADYCLLLARTDPNGPRKHDGISYFIMDMKTPGIKSAPSGRSRAKPHLRKSFSPM